MKQSIAKQVTKVTAKTTGYGRLTKGQTYTVVYPSSNDCKYIFVQDDTGCINGYHIRNF